MILILWAQERNMCVTSVKKPREMYSNTAMWKSTTLILLRRFEVLQKKKIIKTFQDKVNNISGSNVKANMQNCHLSRSSETRKLKNCHSKEEPKKAEHGMTKFSVASWMGYWDRKEY